MLYDIIVAPIEMIVDWVFLFAVNYMEVFGVIGAIVCVSIVINFLTLPIYNVADKIQNEEREAQKKMSPCIERIKAVFSGDERFMILQTFYRQNHYSPIYALRSSVSILIQIPFFMAAYHYLSNSDMLQGCGFLFLKNLGAPDALFSVGEFSVNVLPIFMTLINVVSGIIYTKGFPIREKVQVYGLAAVFLVLLYNSPSGLVLYWIMNNIFSLCKNFVKKTKSPVKVAGFVACGLLFFVLVASFVMNMSSFGWKKKLLFAFVSVCVLATAFSSKMVASLKNKFAFFQTKQLNFHIFTYKKFKQQSKADFFLFLSSAIGLALLVGLLLPSSVIATSPTEFSFLGQTESPLSYIYSSICVFAGFFVLWPVIIYKMFSGKVRAVMPSLFFVTFVCSLFNAYVFKHSYGTLNATFILDSPGVLKQFNLFILLMPCIAIVLVFAVYFVCRQCGVIRFLYGAVFSVCLATAVFGAYKIKYIGDEFSSYKKATETDREEYQKKLADSSTDDIEPVYHLSKDGKNVVILFFDRAMGSFFPYAVEQFPKLKQIYSGFVDYPNTVSYGPNTVLSIHAMNGGYEYSLDNINKRDDVLITEKSDEASSIMPMLFSEAGYDVTLSDPHIYGASDVFSKINNTNVINVLGKYSLQYMNEKKIDVVNDFDKITKNRIKLFSVLQITLPVLRNTYYEFTEINVDRFNQEIFIKNFSNLYYFNELTDFSNTNNTFVFIRNDTTHSPCFLDTTSYDAPSKETLDGSYGNYYPKTYVDITHYHINTATFLAVGKWLDYLRENNCYDNTRIIIVSDHGGAINFKEFKDFEIPMFPALHNPLLLVKDFNARGELVISDEFMTNADTLFLAKEGLGLSNINPFTGNQFTKEKANGINTYPLSGSSDYPEWNIKNLQNRTQFTLENGYHVKDNIFDESNWTKIIATPTQFQ